MTNWIKESKFVIGSQSVEFDDNIVLMDDTVEIFGGTGSATVWTLEDKN